MSRAGDIDRFHKDGFPGLLSPPTSRGSPSLAAVTAAPSGGCVIPTMFLKSEEALWPWQTPWLSLRGWTLSFVRKEEVVATMVVAMSSR